MALQAEQIFFQKLLIITGLGKKLTAGSGERGRDKAVSYGIKWRDCGICVLAVR